jgi:hypothetical protein
MWLSPTSACPHPAPNEGIQAATWLAITQLVLYELPFRADDSYPALPADLPQQLAELVAAGRRGEAVELYQTKAVGIPEDVVAQLRHARPQLQVIALPTRLVAYRLPRSGQLAS